MNLGGCYRDQFPALYTSRGSSRKNLGGLPPCHGQRELIKEVWRLCPQGGPGGRALVGVRRAKPPEAGDILTVKRAILGLNCTSNRTFLKAKTGSTVHKNIPQNGIRQRALQRIAQVAIIWDTVSDVTGLPV